MKQGEIWLVSFPGGAGHEYKKERPAMIVESTEQIHKTNVYTIMPITSNVDNCTHDDIFISANNHNRLHKDSVLKVHHIQTFDSSRFLKRIGNVGNEIIHDVLDYIKVHFGM